MNIDFTEVFNSPDELADFCMLPPHEQDKRLIQLASECKAGLSMVCEIRRQEHATESVHAK